MIFAGSADCDLTKRCAAVVDRDDGVSPLVSINPECDNGTVSFSPVDGHESTGRHISVRVMTRSSQAKPEDPTSPAGRRTDSSHRGNKHGGASPPDSLMLPLG